MDNIQKQILGYLLMAVVGSVVYYITQKLGIWFADPAFLVSLGFILGASELAAYKWIRYSFGLPLEEDDIVVEEEDTT